jgi:hypothetical protein
MESHRLPSRCVMQQRAIVAGSPGVTRRSNEQHPYPGSRIGVRSDPGCNLRALRSAADQPHVRGVTAAQGSAQAADGPGERILCPGTAVMRWRRAMEARDGGARWRRAMEARAGNGHAPASRDPRRRGKRAAPRHSYELQVVVQLIPFSSQKVVLTGDGELLLLPS